MTEKAPWKDYEGNNIYEGDAIHHPSGQQGESEELTPANAQPIEKAPKDGTDVIVFYELACTWCAHIAFYRPAEDYCLQIAEIEAEPGEEPETVEEFTGWWSYIASSVTQTKLEGVHEPTHFIPLPEL